MPTKFASQDLKYSGCRLKMKISDLSTVSTKQNQEIFRSDCCQKLHNNLTITQKNIKNKIKNITSQIQSTEQIQKIQFPDRIVHIFIELVQKLLHKNCKSDSHNLDATFARLQKLSKKIYNFSQYNDQIFILAIIFLDRLNKEQPHLIYTSHNLLKLIPISLMIALKCHIDKMDGINCHFAMMMNVQLNYLNRNQMDFLVAINFWVHVQERVFRFYQDKIMIFWKMRNVEVD